jgi:hypothetical protein
MGCGADCLVLAAMLRHRFPRSECIWRGRSISTVVLALEMQHRERSTASDLEWLHNTTVNAHVGHGVFTYRPADPDSGIYYRENDPSL